MRTVDLNADLGEREPFTSLDREVVAAVTSVSIACGFHAGSPRVMRDTAEACRDHLVAVGAHVSYRDREGFGRRALRVDPDVLAADLAEQCQALDQAAGEVGVEVGYVKPHGALYHAMSEDRDVAAVVIAVVAARAHHTLVAPARAIAATLAADAGVRVVREGFPDRGYLSDGRLAPRDTEGALVDEPLDAARRARALVLDGWLTAVDGSRVAVDVDTLCIHGDTPDAPERARAVRAELEDAGVRLRAFVARPPAPAG